MAFKKTLAQRLLNFSKINSSLSVRNCRISSSSSPTAGKSLTPPSPDKIAPDPGDDGIFRRFLHRRPAYESVGTSPVLPAGEKLLEKLRGMDIGRDRIRLDGLIPPPLKQEESSRERQLSVEDVKKLLRLSQLETVKSRLRATGKSWISHSEFVQTCADGCGNSQQGMELARMLDASGTVIVLGNIVFLRPDQVVKAIQGLMPVPSVHSNDQKMKELEEMEKQKATLDKKAESLVRRELWCGLGYLVIQTAAFMRLTFWELTWDVMEPICFYVTSMYFMAGYAFFLRTSKEPSFEGFFQSRFSAKQKRLMKLHNFNLGRYNELRRDCYPHLPQPPDNPKAFASYLDNAERTLDEPITR